MDGQMEEQVWMESKQDIVQFLIEYPILMFKLWLMIAWDHDETTMICSPSICHWLTAILIVSSNWQYQKHRYRIQCLWYYQVAHICNNGWMIMQAVPAACSIGWTMRKQMAMGKRHNRDPAGSSMKKIKSRFPITIKHKKYYTEFLSTYYYFFTWS